MEFNGGIRNGSWKSLYSQGYWKKNQKFHRENQTKHENKIHKKTVDVMYSWIKPMHQRDSQDSRHSQIKVPMSLSILSSLA